MDHPGGEEEPILAVRRIGTFGFDPSSAARAVVARDLPLEDPGLRGRQVGDGASADLERFSQPCAALGAMFEGEGERGSVGHGPLPSSAGVTRLTPGGPGVRAPLGPTIEGAARRDAAGLRGAIGGGEHGGAGLVAAELLFGPPQLLFELPVLLDGPVASAQSFEEGLALRLGEGDIPLHVLVQDLFKEKGWHVALA
jgi:hypothetical protein